MTKFTSCCLLSFLLLLLLTAPAHAYLDAGSGSYMMQVLLGGLLGAVFSIKLFWQRLKVFFIGLFRHEPAPAPRPDAHE